MSFGQTAIPCTIIRGGTSRGAYFRKDDLPAEERQRDQVLLAVMGGPDELQVDGIGGGHPLTNKVAIVSQSERPETDVDYLFLQVMPGEGRVSTVQNCGNILAGVGPFSIASGLVEAAAARTAIRVHLANSGSRCELTVQTPGGCVTSDGDTRIDGVPGESAAIICDFLDSAGSTCGALLPSGNVSDEIAGYTVTCIDNGMPVVILRASDFAVSGYEPAAELDANRELKAGLEALRRQAGSLMNLGDVAAKTIPKMCLVAAPRDGGLISTRTFIPHDCHRSIGVLGAISVATACLCEGSVAAQLANVPEGREKTVSVEYPAGAMAVRFVVDEDQSCEQMFRRAGVVRTARLLFKGRVYVPSAVWRGNVTD